MVSLQQRRVYLIAVLVAALVTQPLMAAPAKALGNVIFAERAWLGTVPAQAGATVFAGDQLTTETLGTLRVRVGDGQLYLQPSTALVLDQGDATLDAILDRGTVGFAATPSSPLVVRSGGLLVRAKNGTAHGRVEKYSDIEFVVSSLSGELLVTYGKEEHTVASPNSYRVIVDREVYPEQGPQDPAGVGAKSARRTRLVLVLVTLAVAGAAATFVVLQNLSPARP